MTLVPLVHVRAVDSAATQPEKSLCPELSPSGRVWVVLPGESQSPSWEQRVGV